METVGLEFGLKNIQNVVVDRKAQQIDLTCKNQDRVLQFIEAFEQLKQPQLNHEYLKLMENVTSRMICDRMIMQLQPLNKQKRSDIPSPSKLAQDQLLLPYLTKNGEFMFSSTEAMSKFFAKKEPEIDTNKYSLANMAAPDDKNPK